MQITPEFQKACLRLQTNPDFKIFMDWVLAYSDRNVHTLIYETDNTRVLQGKVQAITEIMQAMEKALKTDMGNTR